MATALRKRIAEHAALGAAYFVAAAGTIAGTRFDGGVAFLWVATAVLAARLATCRRSEWPAALAVCAVASILATALVGIGPGPAVPLALVNVGEALIAALLVRRSVGPRPALGSHRWLIAFVLSAGIAAPAAGALVGGATVAAMMGQPLLPNIVHWYTGHALGTLAFMPIAMLVLRGEAMRLIRSSSAAKVLETLLLLVLVALVSLFTFASDGLPLLFLPLLPVVLATFRGGALSAALSIVIISAIGGVLTLDGHGPVAMMDAPIGEQMQFLQLYIAAAMLTVLPANAELERRAELFRALRESEARYRLVTESSTDVVLTVDARGLLRDVSASIRQFSGKTPEELVGQPVTVLLAAEDGERALAGLRAAIATPGGVLRDEFRVPLTRHDERWFESHGRAVLDHEGQVSGVVIALRDITRRKAVEQRLAHAALTDPLTGLPNRRAFHDRLATCIESGAPGCVAMFDIDHFKRVNDRHGHAAGDEFLRRFATLARATVREQDFVARLGGEEFAVVLPETTIEQARLVCERLRQAIADERVHREGTPVGVTVSGGVAPYRPGMAGEEVLHAADMALYSAKEAGRDRLALAA